MIEYWLALGLLSVPCTSDVAHNSNVTIVAKCEMPPVQGPPRPPIWWRPGMFDNKTSAFLTRKAEVKPYVYPAKKKKRKKRRR